MDSHPGGVVRRRFAALLLALIAVLGVSVSAPQPAAANPPGTGVKILCQAVSSGTMGVLLGPVGGLSGAFGSEPACKAVGDVASKQFEEQWKKVWEGPLGDIIKSAQDAAQWTIQKVFTIALMAPSVDLKATGLWGGKRATLSGMLMWLGLLIATAGVMWQLAKMALTGQAKHAGRAMLGWVENIVLSTIGVALFVELLVIGDAISAGLVKGTFDDGGVALDRIVAVMIPKGVGNPVLMLGVVQVLVIVGFVQLVMVFLRQSAIPIICLLLPVVGGGRAGGDVTRQWAPKLITSGMVVVAYKPIVTVIICTGFAEFGSAGTLAEWLRGCATLVLAILAPGPLTKVFAPLGAAAGGGLAGGGFSGALSAAAGYLGGKSGKDDKAGDSGGGSGPTDAVSYAQYVDQVRGQQGGGEDGGPGTDAQSQASRNDAARVPAQASSGGEAVGAGVGETATTGATATSSGMAAAGPVGAAASVGIQVMDGVNDAVQGASGEMSGGNQQ
ncbi:hypothetical protein ACIGXG_32020 [Streptomyces goshikiensis]|uniref:hypothetical protein n=1 Tax=Streptomyces goshikiensis TaxID=1942 RepID=UPI0037D330D4